MLSETNHSIGHTEWLQHTVSIDLPRRVVSMPQHFPKRAGGIRVPSQLLQMKAHPDPRRRQDASEQAAIIAAVDLLGPIVISKRHRGIIEIVRGL